MTWSTTIMVLTAAALHACWNAGRTFLAGAGSVASCGLVLWAMTTSPIALVAALRETSSLFGALIAATLLNERVSPARIAATAVIIAGAVLTGLAGPAATGVGTLVSISTSLAPSRETGS